MYVKQSETDWLHYISGAKVLCRVGTLASPLVEDLLSPRYVVKSNRLSSKIGRRSSSYLKELGGPWRTPWCICSRGQSLQLPPQGWGMKFYNNQVTPTSA